MKITGFILFATLLINAAAYSQSTKRVLFLGNSYTAANSLPTLTATLASSAGDSLIHSDNSPGGYTLQGHSTDPSSINFIKQGNWDYMVLQEQSQKPSWPIAQVMTEVYPYAEILCSTFVAHNTCSDPLFFMTWGRKNGDINNCPNWPPVCTYNGMDSLLSLRYQMLADSNNAAVSPVGEVWHYIRDNYPNIELYSPDESHPSVDGSYAAACTFYALIFQKDPTLINNDYGIDPAKALNIRNSAKIVAYDSLWKWNAPKDTPKANFTFTQASDTVQFSNASIDAKTYNWDFGDGNSSTLFEPKHIYTSPGTFTVSLEANNCDVIDTTSQKVTITVVVPNGIESLPTLNYSIFPNPAQDIINIEFDQVYKVSNPELYNSEGKLVQQFNSFTAKSYSLNLGELPKGIYILSFEIDNRSYRKSIMKN